MISIFSISCIRILEPKMSIFVNAPPALEKNMYSAVFYVYSKNVNYVKLDIIANLAYSDFLSLC